MPRRIFINSRALSPKASIVNSATGLIPQAFPEVVATDKIQYRFFLVDGLGNYDPITGDVTNYTVRLALGETTTQTILTSTNVFTSAPETVDGVVTAAWEGVLDCTVAPVLAAVGQARAVEYYMEFEVKETAGAGTIITYFQVPVQLRNRILN